MVARFLTLRERSYKYVKTRLTPKYWARRYQCELKVFNVYVCKKYMCVCIHTYSLICPPVGLNTNDFPVAMSSSQILFSTYCFPLKGTRAPWKNGRGRAKCGFGLGYFPASQNKAELRGQEDIEVSWKIPTDRPWQKYQSKWQQYIAAYWIK